MKTPLRALLCLAVLALALALTPPPACAGQGRIVNGKLHLLVYFAFEEDDVASWYPLFRRYSEHLYDATERQLQLGSVTFTRCPELKPKADIWIRDDRRGAKANYLGLEKDNRYIFISRFHETHPGGGFGLTHESGHYLWDLRDEYFGYYGPIEVGCKTCSFSMTHRDHHTCTGRSATLASIMDGGTTIHNQRTEFCTSATGPFVDTRHNPGGSVLGIRVVNAQQHKHKGKSCWEQIVASRVGNLSLPQTQPSANVAGHQPVTFRTIDAALSIAIVIDRSGSMSSDDKLAMAKEGGKIGAGLLQDGQRLAVVSFDDDPTVEQGLTEIDASTKRASVDTIEAIRSSGGQTAIGDSLLAAHQQFSATSSCSNVVVLISDGMNNAGTSPESVAATLAAARTRVYTIGVGADADSGTLAYIARTTGGQFFSAHSAGQIRSFFAQIVTDAMGRSRVGGAANQQLGAEQTRDVACTVSPHADRFIASLAHTPDAAAAFELFDPSGRTITASTMSGDVRAFTSNGQIVIEVQDPLAGTWRARVVSPRGASEGYGYDVTLAVDAAALHVGASTPAGAFAYPAPVTVRVAVIAGTPVAGASVVGRARDPSGAVLPGTFSLFDDGSPENGDQEAGDGIYSAQYHAYTISGDYNFFIDVENVDGVEATDHELEEGEVPLAIAPFTVSLTMTATVTGVPTSSDLGTLDVHGLIHDLDGQLVRAEALPFKPLIDVVLTADSSESVHVPAMRFRATDARGAPLSGVQFGLYVDADQDGLIDTPQVAQAIVQSDVDGLVRFAMEGGGNLFTVRAGESTRVLVALVDPIDVAETASQEAPLPGSFPWVFATVLLGYLLTRRNPIPSVGRLAALRCAGVAVLLLATACGGSGGLPFKTATTASETTTTYELTLLPGDLDVRGARSGQTLAPAGEAISVRTTLAADGGQGRVVPVPLVGGDDHGDLPGSGTLISAPGTYTGTLEAEGDRDWFRLPVVGGTEYVVRTTLGTLSDSTLRALGEAGGLLDSNDDADGGLHSRVTFTPVRSMVVSIQVAGYSDGHAGSYVLHVETP